MNMKSMKKSKTLKLPVLASAVCLVMGFGSVAVANDAWYVGGGFGTTVLDPEPRNTPLTVSDDKSSGYKVFVGKDISDRISVEGYYADLGEAGISPAGTIDYTVYGVSALYRFYNADSFVGNQPIGLSLFGLAGVGGMSNTADLVTYTRENDAHLHWGAGAEYGFPGGFSARTDIDLFDTDAQMVSVSLQKRFGGTGEEAIALAAPMVDPINVNTDSDRDGVYDSVDQCDGTPLGVVVDALGCPAVKRVEQKQTAGYYLGRVYFALDSSYLSAAARGTLDRVAEFLKSRPSIKIRTEGHTDSIESEKYNQWLSEKRAKRVKDYLVLRGIRSDRMRTIGFGENNPVASNNNAEGRQKNRRTEFNVIAQ